MNDTTLSKQEYQYLKNIEKLEQLVEKLELKLKEKTELEKELLAKIETLEKSVTENSLAHSNLEEIIKVSNEEKEKLNVQLKNLQKESVDKSTIISENIKKIELLESKALTEADLLFFFACKADLILTQFYNQNKLNISAEELKSKNFPSAIIEQAMKQPFETTNYQLSFKNKSFHLKYKSKS